MPTYFERDGVARIAVTPAERVRLVFDGWTQVGRPADEPPPKSGAGSSTDAWREYATEHDVEVPADAGREDIIETLDKAGVPTQEVGE